MAYNYTPEEEAAFARLEKSLPDWGTLEQHRKIKEVFVTEVRIAFSEGKKVGRIKELADGRVRATEIQVSLPISNEPDGNCG